MRRLIAAFVLCLLPTVLTAQTAPATKKKEITLREAAMSPFLFTASRGLAGLKWRPGRKCVTCLKRTKSGPGLVSIAVKDGKETMLISADDMAKAAKRAKLPQVNINVLRTATWSADGSTLRFVANNQAHLLHVATNKIMSGLTIPEDAEDSAWSKFDVHVAYSKGKNVFVNKPDGSTFQVTSGGFEFLTHGLSVSRVEFGITNGMWWDPTGRRLAFYREDLRPIEPYPYIDWNPTPAKHVLGRYPMAGHPGSIVTVGVYDTQDDSVTWLKTNTAVDQYLTNVTWSPDGQTIYIAHVNRAQNKMDLKSWDAKSGAFVKTLFTEKDEQWIEPEHGPIFLPDNSGDFLWFSYRGGFHNLYLVSSAGKFMQRVTNGDWDVSAFQKFSQDLSKIYFVGAGETPTESHLFSAPLINASQRDTQRQEDTGRVVVIKERATQLTQGGGQHRAVMSPGEDAFFDAHSQLGETLKTNLVQVGGLSMQIHEAKDPWTRYVGGKEEMFKIKAQDGSDLYGHIILPPNLDESKKYPVLLYVYGGPHAQLIKNEFGGGAGFSSGWFHYMACQGIIVIRIDGHGTPRRGIEFMQAIHRNMGRIEIEDQIAGLEYLFKRPYVDRSRVGVHGWSYGGFMTLSLMTRKGDYFKCGISGAPVTDWSYYETGYGERYMDRPEENKAGYKESMPATHLSGLKGRLLVVHGSSDVTVVWQNTMAFLAACIDQDKPVEYMTYPGQLHGLRGKHRWHFYQKMTKFFLRELTGQ